MRVWGAALACAWLLWYQDGNRAWRYSQEFVMVTREECLGSKEFLLKQPLKYRNLLCLPVGVAPDDPRKEP
jgi:hypothetical protein